MFTDDAALTRFSFEASLPPEAAATEKRTEICQDYQRGRCPNGDACPNRHILSAQRHVQLKVCRHWLRGACANGDDCAFLHEFQSRFVPPCVFYERNGECTNPECPFTHVRQDDLRPECAAYRRGFCPLGPQCRWRHVRRAACPFYMAGFCPLGPRCPRAHPAMELHDRAAATARVRQRLTAERAGDPSLRPDAVCHSCYDPGHIAPECPGKQRSLVLRMLAEVREPGDAGEAAEQDTRGQQRRCFYCKQEGHLRDDCPLKARHNSGGNHDSNNNNYNNNSGGNYNQRKRPRQ